MKLLRELFKFNRYSPLDRRTCVERLTMDYQKEMIKKGLYPEVVSGFKWGIYVRWHKKTEERSGVLICSHSNWGGLRKQLLLSSVPKELKRRHCVALCAQSLYPVRDARFCSGLGISLRCLTRQCDRRAEHSPHDNHVPLLRHPYINRFYLGILRKAGISQIPPRLS